MQSVTCFDDAFESAGSFFFGGSVVNKIAGVTADHSVPVVSVSVNAASCGKGGCAMKSKQN
jgi:hypothetical protein